MRKKVSNRIKEQRKRYGYTQKELADLLGVAQTTVANYEQGTRVPDADKLHKMADIFRVTLDYLLDRVEIEREEARKDTSEEQLDEVYCSFLKYLLEGNKEVARSIIMDSYKRNVKIEDLYFKVFEKALKEVGMLWELGKIEVWKEHFISEFIQDCMRELKVREKKRKGEPNSLIALTAGAELHNIGIKMVTDLLELEGWTITYLGSNLPVQSCISAIENVKPSVVAISITLEHHIEAGKNMIAAIREKLNGKSPIIIVGGGAFNRDKELWKHTGADFYGLNPYDIIKLCKVE
jgi:methanogenic corrinoid protein MtbC1